METSDLGGCHPLTNESIAEEVARRSPGDYALGYLDGGSFVPFYVGRSDVDVGHRLHSWVGIESRSSRFAPSSRAAYGSRRRGALPVAAPWLQPVGLVVDGCYTHFAFRYAASAEEAFHNECRSYHSLGVGHCLDNERHPVPPDGAGRACSERACA